MVNKNDQLAAFLHRYNHPIVHRRQSRQEPSNIVRRSPVNKRRLLSALAAIAVSAAFSSVSPKAPEKNLRVVIIRHGEKPPGKDAYNLSCKGMNRALHLPAVLYQKFGKPDYVYVPSLTCDAFTDHARMFQTVTPFAVKYDLTINSKFGEKAYKKVAGDVMQKEGTVLLVWEHSAIQHIAKKLGIENASPWPDDDFDSIWIIDFKSGKALLAFDKEGIVPSGDCSF